jgi:hypothetical protein
MKLDGEALTQILDDFVKVKIKLIYCGEREERAAIARDIGGILEKLTAYEKPLAEAWTVARTLAQQNVTNEVAWKMAWDAVFSYAKAAAFVEVVGRFLEYVRGTIERPLDDES